MSVRSLIISFSIVTILLASSGVALAEYRTVTKDEIISILADPRTTPARSENLATEFNSSWDQSWELFANETVSASIWEEDCTGTDGEYVTTINSEWDTIAPATQPNATASVTYDNQYGDSTKLDATNESQAAIWENSILDGDDAGIQCSAMWNQSEGGVLIGIYDSVQRDVEVYLYDYGIWAHNDIDWFEILEINENVWYTITILTDFDASTYSLYIDGEIQEVDGDENPEMFGGAATSSEYVGARTLLGYNSTGWIKDFHIYDGTESQRRVGGRYIGGALPESRARHNVTGNQISVGTLLSLSATDIGPCASEMWVRSPIQYQEGMELLVQIWAVSGSSFINTTDITATGPDIPAIGNPRLIWEWDYDLDYEWTSNVTVNRTYLRVTAPIYPNRQYFASFTATSLTEAYADVYWTQCDMFSDERYMSYIWTGDGVSWIELDPGVSILVTSTSGGGLIGRELNKFSTIRWEVEVDGAIANGTYLTFTMPFIMESGASTSVLISVSGWNDTEAVWEMYDTLYDSRDFVILSEEIDGVTNETYSTIRIDVNFDGSKPVKIWLQDPNYRMLDDATTTTVLMPHTSQWSWTPAHSLRITDGALGLYDRPIIRVDAVWVHYNTVTEHLSPTQFWLMDNLFFRSIANGMEWVGGQIALGAKQLLEWIEAGLQWVWDRIIDALGVAGAWLWDHVGAYVYAAVSVIINAFADAAITLIQISLVVIPLVIFAMLINWWAKFLNSFKLWYTQGYEAYARYLEYEMLHIFAVAQKAGSVIANPASIATVAATAARKQYAELSGDKTLARKERALVNQARKKINQARKKIKKVKTKAKARPKSQRELDKELGPKRYIE